MLHVTFSTNWVRDIMQTQHTIISQIVFHFSPIILLSLINIKTGVVFFRPLTEHDSTKFENIFEKNLQHLD